MALGFFNQYRVTGALLILAFITFAIGASLPLLGAKGNMGFFSLSEREQLLAIAGNAAAWRWCNILIGAAAVVLLAGLSMLTTGLESVKELTFSRLGLIGILLAVIVWLLFSAYRAAVMTRAAQDLAALGAPAAANPATREIGRAPAQMLDGTKPSHSHYSRASVASASGSAGGAGLAPPWPRWGSSQRIISSALRV